MMNYATGRVEITTQNHGFAVDRLHVTKFLKQGVNRISIRFVKGATCYWFRKLLVRCTYPPG